MSFLSLEIFQFLHFIMSFSHPSWHLNSMLLPKFRHNLKSLMLDEFKTISFIIFEKFLESLNSTQNLNFLHCFQNSAQCILDFNDIFQLQLKKFHVHDYGITSCYDYHKLFDNSCQLLDI